MASSIITSIDSSLHNLRVIYAKDTTEVYRKKLGMVRLRNLKVFLLCARKLRNDARLRSLLVRIKDAVRRIREETQRPEVSFAFGEQVDAILHETQLLREEIDVCYITMSDCKRRSSSLTADVVVKITDSILENIVDFLNFKCAISVEGMDALGVQVTLLKNFFNLVSVSQPPRMNFLCIATQTSVEQRQLEDLLIHFEAVAINAARLFLMCRVEKFHEEWRKEMESNCSMLLQKIKPSDPQVYQTYTSALSSSKLSSRFHSLIQDMDGDTIIVLKNFLDSLISVLWDVLRLDTCHLASMKDQRQVLYEGLRFLRTILKPQPKKFDKKIRALIGHLVCDAGVIICSFHQTHVEIDHGLQDLLERIMIIRTKVEEKVSRTSIFNFPRTNELGFVDSLLENLMELTSGNAEPIAKSLIQTILEELAFLRSFMGETLELRNEQEEFQALWNRVLEMAYRVEFLTDNLVVGDISNFFSVLSNSIIEDIRGIETDVLKISSSNKKTIKVKKVTRISSHVLSQSTPSVTNEVVGFHEQTTSIRDRLERGSKQLRIVVISGMAGQGKTTVASKVYNDPSVMCHFHLRAWCPISQVLDKGKVLLELLNQIEPGNYSKMTEQDLAERLRRSLKQRRYLIFLDDVWNIEVWNILEGSFPDDSIGSRIMLTSRHRNVAPQAMLDDEPVPLRSLTEYESLELLQRKLFHGKGWPPSLHELGMKIVEKCKGLPLTIVIVAGLLATTKQEGWNEILDGLSSGVISSTDQCMNTLELSYKHLPDYLKPCFLYFGAFPEDQEISVKRLIRLWIAEGFVRKTNLKRLEDVAEDYMVDLIERSLVIVTKQRSTGGAKACRIHDLLHDFCLTKGKQENFFHLLRGYDQLSDFNEPCYLRRLCIHSEPDHFKESKLFCPRARSLLFFSSLRNEWFQENWLDISLVIHTFKLIKVLDLEQINVGEVFPCEIELLVLLKYLAIRGEMRVIPSSIGNLSYLETLIVGLETKSVLLPDTLWNLQKLKYLYIRTSYIGGGCLPFKNLEDSSVLYELDSLSGAVFHNYDSMEEQMSKFPNIRKLKCTLFQSWDCIEEDDDIIVPDFLSQLESLHMKWDNHDHFNFEFHLPANLKKLTLSKFKLPWRKISTIGKLPNLEVLKLLVSSFRGEAWNVEEGEFLKLKFLKLSKLNIVKWTASDDQFPCLQKLALDGCICLQEIPSSCLENILTLEMIEVSYCSRTVKSLVKHIEEEQVNMGNSSIKVRIQDYH